MAQGNVMELSVYTAVPKVCYLFKYGLIKTFLSNVWHCARVYLTIARPRYYQINIATWLWTILIKKLCITTPSDLRDPYISRPCFNDVSEAKGGQKIDRDQWTLRNAGVECPWQPNGNDCGVFAMLCDDFLSDDLCLTYNMNDMEFYRCCHECTAPFATLLA
jgi:hypothetical protein